MYVCMYVFHLIPACQFAWRRHLGRVGYATLYTAISFRVRHIADKYMGPRYERFKDNLRLYKLSVLPHDVGIPSAVKTTDSFFMDLFVST